MSVDPDSGRSSAALRRPVVGAGLLAAGAVAATLAFVAGLPWLRTAPWVRPSELAGAAVVALVASWTSWAAGAQSGDGAAGRAAAGRRGRVLAGAAIVLGAAGAVLAWSRVVTEVRGGLPTPALPRLAVGLTLVAAGVAQLAFGYRLATTASAGGPRRSRPELRAAAVTAGTGVVLALAAGALVPRLALDATTADRAEGRPAAPAPREVAWAWTSPAPLAEWDGIAPAGPGVAVVAGDRVVALDGATGAERWHYRRRGATVGGVWSGPTGRWVVAGFTSSSDDSDRLVALDGATGEVVLDRATAGAWRGAVTDTTLVHRVYSGPEEGYEAVDLATGGRLWTWSPPEGCLIPLHVGSPAAAAGDGVLVVLACEEVGTDAGDGAARLGYVLLGLDARSGEERWRHDRPVPGPAEDVVSLVQDGWVTLGPGAADGSAVSLAWRGPAEPDGYVSGTDLVDAVTGELLVAEGAGGTGAWDPPLALGPGVMVASSPSWGGPLVRIDLATGERTELSEPCGNDWAVTSGAVVETCVDLDPDGRPEAGGPAQGEVRVTPWAGGGRPRRVDVTYDLAPRGRRGPLQIEAFPHAVVTYAPGGRSLIGLG